jgi:hypothetical protein
MMSPVLGRVAAALIDSGQLPDDLRERGVTPADLAPGRTALRESVASTAE